MHPYHSERIVARAGCLAHLARIVGMHHERVDGSGYHRGSRGYRDPAPRSHPRGGPCVGLDAAAETSPPRARSRPSLRRTPSGRQRRLLRSAGRERRLGGSRAPGRGPQDGSERVERARGRGAAARCGGPLQPRDRRAPLHRPPHRRTPCSARLSQDRRLDQAGGGDVRGPARALGAHGGSAQN